MDRSLIPWSSGCPQAIKKGIGMRIALILFAAWIVVSVLMALCWSIGRLGYRRALEAMGATAPTDFIFLDPLDEVEERAS